MSISGMKANTGCDSQMTLNIRQETSGIKSRTMAAAIHNKIEEQVVRVKAHKTLTNLLLHEVLIPTDMARSTFQLPAVEKLLREFLPIEEAVSDILAPQICWAPPEYKPAGSSARALCTRLWPVRTDGDGDCLLHAVSLTLWGVHDRSLVLRKLIAEVLLDKLTKERLFRIWEDGQLRADAAADASFKMNSTQVTAEWKMLVQAANTPSAYLSSFHAFVLANVLRRPIIIYGDRFVRNKNGEPYAPCDIRGVYLPTLLPASFCYDVPLAIGYTCVAVGKVGHFTALVGIETELKHLPLVDENGDTLPIRYGVRSASPTLPDPVGDALDKYLKTTRYTTTEGRTYRLAIIPRAVMTSEASMVGRTMARMAQASFERLSKEQEVQIRQQVEVATPTSSAPADCTAACVPAVCVATDKAQSAPVMDGRDRSVSPGNRSSDEPTVGSLAGHNDAGVSPGDSESRTPAVATVKSSHGGTGTHFSGQILGSMHCNGGDDCGKTEDPCVKGRAGNGVSKHVASGVNGDGNSDRKIIAVDKKESGNKSVKGSGGEGGGSSSNVGHASRARTNSDATQERKQDRSSGETDVNSSLDGPKTSLSSEGGTVASPRHKRFFGAFGVLSTVGSWKTRKSSMDSPSASNPLLSDSERDSSTSSKRKPQVSPTRSTGGSSALTPSSASEKIRRTMGQRTLSEKWRWRRGGTSGSTPRGRQVQPRSNERANGGEIARSPDIKLNQVLAPAPAPSPVSVGASPMISSTCNGIEVHGSTMCVGFEPNLASSPTKSDSDPPKEGGSIGSEGILARARHWDTALTSDLSDFSAGDLRAANVVLNNHLLGRGDTISTPKSASPCGRTSAKEEVGRTIFQTPSTSAVTHGIDEGVLQRSKDATSMLRNTSDRGSSPVRTGGSPSSRGRIWTPRSLGLAAIGTPVENDGNLSSSSCASPSRCSEASTHSQSSYAPSHFPSEVSETRHELSPCNTNDAAGRRNFDRSIFMGTPSDAHRPGEYGSRWRGRTAGASLTTRNTTEYEGVSAASNRLAAAGNSGAVIATSPTPAKVPMGIDRHTVTSPLHQSGIRSIQPKLGATQRSRYASRASSVAHQLSSSAVPSYRGRTDRVVRATRYEVPTLFSVRQAQGLPEPTSVPLPNGVMLY